MDVNWFDLLGLFINSLFAAAAAVAAVWKFLDSRVDKAIESEKEDRMLADQRIEEKLRDNNDKVHVAIGKIEMLDTRFQKAEHSRVREMAEIRMSLQKGLHKIQVELERIKR